MIHPGPPMTVQAILQPFADLPAHWLREAEVSFARHDPQRIGFQTRFDEADELRAFLERFGLDAAPCVERDEAVRSRFPVNPSHWAKIGTRDGRAVEASQYFLLDPSCHYPISTLRVFARRHGSGASPLLETILQPALAAADTRWGLALKPGAAGQEAAVFCNLSRGALTAVLERMAARAVMAVERAASLLRLVDELRGLEATFLTLDPADPSRVAVDVEDPTQVDALGEWLSRLCPHPPRYLKSRLQGDVVRWSAYYPWSGLLSEKSAADSLDDIRRYYERTHDDYLSCVGTTLQAALVADTPAESNRALAKRAGLRDGMHVLDAGCGVCGPALDIARTLDVTIDAVTLSPSQARTARDHIRAQGLEARVRVHEGDFHALPLADDAVDAAILLESSSYAHDPPALFAELHRVLRSGGRLYIKDFFRHDDPLQAPLRRALQDYDYTYSTQTRTLAEISRAVRAAGFQDIEVGSLEGASMAHFHAAMVDASQTGSVTSAFMTALTPTPSLSRFGRWHRRAWEALPVVAMEIRARKGEVK